MDQERMAKNHENSDTTGLEHNYTNSQDDTTITISQITSSNKQLRTLAPKQPATLVAQTYTTPTTSPQIYGTGGYPMGHTTDLRPRAIRRDAFNRIRRSEAELGKAAEMVRGGMTFQTASDTFNIPISTIRFYMARRGILPQRRRGRGSSGTRDDDLIHPPFEIIHYRLPDIDKPL